jgi:hypothetical protein
MDCKRYQDWLADSALGDLEIQREQELRAHLAICEMCQVEAARRRQLLLAIDDGVAAMVKAESDPAFVDRLRRRLAEPMAPVSSALPGWVPATVVSLAVVVSLIAVLMQPHGSTVSKREVPPFALDSGPTQPVQQLARTASKATGVKAHNTIRVRARFANSAELPDSKENLAVVVPPGQLRALADLARNVRSGRIQGLELSAEPEEESGFLSVAPIEIPPIEIAHLNGTELSPAAALENR